MLVLLTVTKNCKFLLFIKKNSRAGCCGFSLIKFYIIIAAKI